MPEETKPPDPKGITAAEVEAKVRELIATKANGDAEKLCRALFKTAADLRNQLAAAQSSVLPKDHVAVPKADADLLASYRELGSPQDLKSARDELPTVRGELARTKHESNLSGVAAKLGWQPEVLSRLAPVGVEFVAHAEKDKAGKETETFQVKDTGPDGKERVRSLSQWQDDPEVRPLLPALKPEGKAAPSPGDVPVSGSGGYQPRARTTARRDESESDVGRHVPARSYGRM